MVDAKAEGRHPTQRRPNEMGAIDFQGIHQPQDILAQILEAIVAVGRGTFSMTAAVIPKDTITVRQGGNLIVPDAVIGRERMAENQPRSRDQPRRQSVDPVVEFLAVYGDFHENSSKRDGHAETLIMIAIIIKSNDE